MQAMVTKNVHGKSHPQQQKISSRITKGKQQLKQLLANPRLMIAMMQVNQKFVIGRPMLTVDALHKASKLVSSFITTTSIITSWVKT
jgi:hypothetical protein